ncbi:MAG: hypothetical protein OIN90_08515 [Candidatus Methanoperedens sp.]|nr:hypothetical protein [Candidatus Methanoperedens sp.]
MDAEKQIESLLQGIITIAIPALFAIFVAPRFGITDSNIILLLSSVLMIIVVVILYIIYLPVVEFEFIDQMNPLVLLRDLRTSRAGDLKFNVVVKPKFHNLLGLFLISNVDFKHIFFQLFWIPRESLQAKKNYKYNSLSIKDGYPLICPCDMVAKQPYTYSLKISCTQYNEANQLDIYVKPLINSKKIRLKLLLYFIKIKAQKKGVVIGNQ